MSEMIVTLEGGAALIAKAKQLQIDIVKRLITEVNLISVQMQSHLRTEYFKTYDGNTEDNKLQNRTKDLSSSIQPIPAKQEGDIISGGISIGQKYAHVHFGKVGATTTITGKPWLAIPLPAALDNRGVAKGRAKDEAVFGKTFIIKSKTNPSDLVIYGKYVQQKGKNAGSIKKGRKAGQEQGDAIPLFVLKHQVEVKTRVHPEDLWKWVKPVLGKSLEALKQEILK